MTVLGLYRHPGSDGGYFTLLVLLFLGVGSAVTRSFGLL